MDNTERGFLVLGAVGAAVFLLALASVLTSSLLVGIDAPAATALSSWPGWYGPTFDFLGSILVVGPVIAIAVAYLAWRRQWWAALKLALMPIAGEGAVLVLKYLIHRDRPSNLHETGYSFVSGHATNGAILGCLAAWIALRHPRARPFVVPLVAFAAAWALAMAASRVAWGVHYASDVIGGLGLGAAISGFGLAIVTEIERRSLVRWIPRNP